jgi:hypothetical protein
MKKTKEVKTTLRKSAYVITNEFCHYAKEHDFIEVTEWTNNEGFDLTIESERHKNVKLSLTWGEWDAIKAVGTMLYKM